MLKMLVVVPVLLCVLIIHAQEAPAAEREKLSMDFGWKFAFGHPYDAPKDFNTGTGYFSYLAKAGYADGAAAADFDDRSWRTLDLPHDWAVEQPFSAKASFSHGFKAIGRKFPEASVGWYRKKFVLPAKDTGRRICVVFDGVFRNSIVWVNGHYLGTNESGYNGFQYDITDLLHYGGANTIAVRVDASMEEGWFYEGAGIYRHVWLTKTNPVHVAPDGCFVSTQVQQDNAAVQAIATIVNEGNILKNVDVVQTVVDAAGAVVASERKTGISLQPFESKDISFSLSVKYPRLWDLGSPYLYRCITSVLERSRSLDSFSTTFGIRTIRFDAHEGFFLNGKPVKLKGTNNHQDHAGVGTAMPDEMQYWRIRTLKAMGSNAYRCSHHPPTPELLEACDHLGMLVLDENRLMRTTADGLNEMKKMIVRDRNHPSVIAWSIGNEEWAIENNMTGERIAGTLQNFAHSLDSTRPTTAGISGGFRSGISSVLEVMGYNYMGNGDIEAHHRQFPGQPAMGTEEGSTFATRGIYRTDDVKHYSAAYDQKPRSTFYSIEEGWRFYAARPYLAGMFIWTGFDYRGEPTPYGWPSVTSYFGMMDLCGFPKDNVYYLRSWWADTPVLHILPHWNWHGQEGKPIDVWAYSNCEEVELFLNGKSQGKKRMEMNGHLEWKVSYTPGTLKAIGYKNGKIQLTEMVKTTEEASALQLHPHKPVLSADGEDILMVTVQAMDRNKNFVPTASDEITFSIEGPGRIIGVGNGDPTSLEKDKYTEDIQTVAIENLREKPLSGMEDTAGVAAQATDTNWKTAFQDRDYHHQAPAYLYKGSFSLPQDFTASQVTLFYKSIGVIQSIYINGRKIADHISDSAAAKGFLLGKDYIHSGSNIITVLATPVNKLHDWDNVNTDPGLIQLLTPAEPWKRKLFNGLAQVIVQSTKQPGEISITAASPHMKPAVFRIKAKAVSVRPAVE